MTKKVGPIVLHVGNSTTLLQPQETSRKRRVQRLVTFSLDDSTASRNPIGSTRPWPGVTATHRNDGTWDYRLSLKPAIIYHPYFFHLKVGSDYTVTRARSHDAPSSFLIENKSDPTARLTTPSQVSYERRIITSPYQTEMKHTRT